MLHAALNLTVVLWVLSPRKALAFVAVQQAVFSLYLGISFAPNHKGMPIIESATAAGFARRQVVTARNIRPGRSPPSCSAAMTPDRASPIRVDAPAHLRRVQGLVRDLPRSDDFGYREESLPSHSARLSITLATLERGPAAVLAEPISLAGRMG